MPEGQKNPQIWNLKEHLAAGRISRREFTSRLLALGLTMPAIGTILAAPVPAAAAVTPKRGGRVRLAFEQTSADNTLDPVGMTTTTDGTRGFQIYNPLFRISPKLTPEPELAESWETNATADDWVFKLRKGVEFHNGKALTAADVVYSMSRHMGEESTSAAKALLSEVTAVTAEDKHTVRFKLASPNADLPIYLGDYHTQIVPESFTDFDNAIGTGPFKVKTFVPGVRAIFARNENYWKEGLPYLDEIESFGIPDVVARTNAFLSGDVDVMMGLDPKTLDKINANPDVEIVSARSGSYWLFVMRRDSPPFDNVDAALAVKYLQDRELILKNILKGYGQIGNDHPIAPTDPFYCHEIPVRPYDPDKAKFHLKKAGLDSLEVTLHTSTSPGVGAIDAALLLQQSAAKGGVKIKVQREPSDGYWSNVWMKRPFVMSGWNARPTADLMFTTAYTSAAPWNETFWKNGAFDKLLIEARGTLDVAKRKQLFCEMQRLIHEDGGAAVPAFSDYLDGKSAKVKGFVPHPAGALSGFQIGETLWLDT